MKDLKSDPASHPTPTRLVSGSRSFSRPIPPKRPGPSTRKSSKGKGTQVGIDPGEKTTNHTDQNPANHASGDESQGHKAEKSAPNSMLGFLSRKKGREKSPKPKEAGVIGKYGARQIVT